VVNTAAVVLLQVRDDGADVGHLRERHTDDRVQHAGAGAVRRATTADGDPAGLRVRGAVPARGGPLSLGTAGVARDQLGRAVACHVAE
jgi:hypothetical protein